MPSICRRFSSWGSPPGSCQLYFHAMQLFRSCAWLFLATTAFAQSAWMTVRSTECGYTAKFPQQPTFNSDAVPQYAGGFHYSEYTIEEDHLILNVICSDVPKGMTEAKLDLAKKESAKMSHAKIIRERKARGVRDLDVKGEETLGRIKLIAAGNHYIQVIALVDDQKNLALANKFVESFQMTSRRKPKQNATH
jgi:hypothetical protein